MEKVNLETIRLAQGGDELAFQEIYDQCYSHVFYYALSLSKNEADARDITQETFLQVYRSIKDLHNPDYFPLWLNRIVYSKFQRVLSKQRESLIEADDLKYHLDHSEKAKRMNDAYLLDDESVIREMIQSLSDKQKEVIQLMYYEQYTIAEIAKMKKLPEGTVKSRVFDAKKALKLKMEEFERLEGRKLTLHMDVSVPISGFALLAKLKDWLQMSSMQQTMMVASAASLVVVSTVAVTETAHVIQENNRAKSEMKEEKPLIKRSFTPVQYQEEQINTAKSAYYTLMAWAPDANHVRKKTQEEKAMVRSLLDELIVSDSKYLDDLKTSGWMNAYLE